MGVEGKGRCVAFLRLVQVTLVAVCSTVTVSHEVLTPRNPHASAGLTQKFLQVGQEAGWTKIWLSVLA